MSRRKTELEQAVRDAFLPFTVEFEYPDRYLRSGDHVGFAVFDSVPGDDIDEEESEREIYREPHWRFSAAGVEAWIESARQKVISRGYQLSEWRKPAWMSEVLRPGDDMEEEEEAEG